MLQSCGIGRDSCHRLLSEKLAEPGGSSHSKILIYEAKSFESFN